LAAQCWAHRAKAWGVARGSHRACIQLDRYPSRLEVLGNSTPLLQKVWAFRQLVRVNGDDFAFPTIETCLVLRAWSMRQPDRDLLDKHMDAHDIHLLADSFPSMDEDMLCHLWASAHPRRGREILKIVVDARAGQLRF
jgi:hypothetical protein